MKSLKENDEFLQHSLVSGLALGITGDVATTIAKGINPDTASDLDKFVVASASIMNHVANALLNPDGVFFELHGTVIRLESEMAAQAGKIAVLEKELKGMKGK